MAAGEDPIRLSASTPNWLWRLDAHHRLLLSIGIALLVYLVIPSPSWAIRSLITWDVSIVSFLLLEWSVILTAHPRQIRLRAQTDDTGRVIIAGLVVSAACASLFAIILLLRTNHQMPPLAEGFYLTLSVVAVVASWLIMHTMFSLRYAHYYYRSVTNSSETVAGGLEFPQEPHPDYLDFAYFAIGIGMTAQVSDVQVTSRLMRRMVLLHSLLSFAFNTIVIALSVNAISQLI